MEYFLDGVFLILVIINTVLIFMKRIDININVHYPQPEAETYSNLEELQKQADEEYENEQKNFVGAAEAIQKLFTDEEAET